MLAVCKKIDFKVNRNDRLACICCIIVHSVAGLAAMYQSVLCDVMDLDVLNGDMCVTMDVIIYVVWKQGSVIFCIVLHLSGA